MSRSGGSRADRKRHAHEGKLVPVQQPRIKRRLVEKLLPQNVRTMCFEGEAYMKLLEFEKKLDTTMMRKRLEIQEALKQPLKLKRKLRISISHTYPINPPETSGEDDQLASWELRVEGKLLDDVATQTIVMHQQELGDSGKPLVQPAKRKFSSFFKSLVIELDKNMYGPDQHLVEWHRSPNTQETDGFQVKRIGNENVKCTVLLMLDYQPHQYKLENRLARRLGIHTQSKQQIISALWRYIKTHSLQDPREREWINCDVHLKQVFECNRFKFSEIPQRLQILLQPPEPIVIHHTIDVQTPEANRKPACYDIDVEIDDPVKQHMSVFLQSQQNLQELVTLDSKLYDMVDQIQAVDTNRRFFTGFAERPQQFIYNWLASQSRDVKLMHDIEGDPEAERRASFYRTQPWMREAVQRHLNNRLQDSRNELENALGLQRK